MNCTPFVRSIPRLTRLATLTGLLVSGVPAGAEIILLANGTATSADTEFMYTHPRMRSVVFATAYARDQAILPPSPYFVTPAPLLMRPGGPYIAYPPVAYRPGVNVPAHPSNRDNATYALTRAHAFGQELYTTGTYANLGTTPTLYASPYGYGYGYGLMPAYPPVNNRPGFNQPAHPSNRDNTTYNLERAHRFSMDAYRKP